MKREHLHTERKVPCWDNQHNPQWFWHNLCWWWKCSDWSTHLKG